MSTFNLYSYVNSQIKEAKKEFRTTKRVMPATVSSYYSMEKWEAIMKRYKRFCNYMTETKHNWQVLKTTSFADNSTEQLQKSLLTGKERIVFLSLPSGDACF